MQMMRPIGIGLAMLLCLSAGCAIDGKWSLASVEPGVARGASPYEVLRLERDGSFYAEARAEGATRTTSGTYRHEKRVLALRERDGAEHAFTAHVAARELKLESTWQDRKLVATFTRVGR